ncbi:alpha/beta hydrolase [Paraburkholderia phytofirmans]|uniref:alpha/beta fold hydrolase n=1 Tax=Paraburkholderia phytofirmans TaxID=261302 RepID=UPI0038B9A8BD
MTRPRALIVTGSLAALVALFGAAQPAPVEAKTVHYANEKACPVVADRPDHKPSIREQIAHTVNGDIAYYRFGHGTPIVLQTGFRATVAEWDAAFLTDLAKRHEVIVFDNRGIGRSEPAASSFTARDMTLDAAALIDTLRLADVTFVGWSMGGAIAQQLALDAPLAVRRIVLMSAPAPGSLGAPVTPDVEATLSGKVGTTFMDVMRVLFPPNAVDAAQRCFRQNMFQPAGYQPPAISATVTEGQSALLHDWSSDEAAAAALKKVRVATLILTGADDQVLPKQNSEALAGQIPHAQLLVVRSAGHAMMYQYPHALAAAINTFIATSRPPGSAE